MTDQEYTYNIEHNRLDNGFPSRGSIEVIVGSMFSGKTEELLRRVRRAIFAKLRVEVFKPNIDTRYSIDDIVSHDQNNLAATPVESPMNILLLSSDAQIVAIDEAQFFDERIVGVVQELADSGIRVIVSGLDMDFQRTPFGPMPALMAIADTVTKVHAVCVSCGAPAMYSHRLLSDKKQVVLGEKKEYEPLCRHCFLALSQKEGAV